MARWLVGALLICASFAAAACPLCMGGGRPSTAQQLGLLPHAVLALPSTDDGGYRVVEVIKGERPAGGRIAASVVRAEPSATGGGKPLLLAREDSWPVWISLGAIGIDHAGWLRQLAAGQSVTARNAQEWRARVALALPYLQHQEPLAAEIAYGELASAPYAAMLAAKSRLDLPAIRRWLADPNAARQPLYILLLGIAGDAHDAAGLERRLEAAWEAGDVMNLGPMIAADLQLRGPARMAWVDARYLADRKRSTREIEAVLLALSVHGNANGSIPRERVIQSYRTFMKARREIAGYVAQDLAAWRYWDAVPEYVSLMKSDLRQQYASRLAIIAYLKQSPVAEARDIALQTSGEPAARR